MGFWRHFPWSCDLLSKRTPERGRWVGRVPSGTRICVCTLRWCWCLVRSVSHRAEQVASQITWLPQPYLGRDYLGRNHWCTVSPFLIRGVLNFWPVLCRSAPRFSCPVSGYLETYRPELMARLCFECVSRVGCQRRRFVYFPKGLIVALCFGGDDFPTKRL